MNKTIPGIGPKIRNKIRSMCLHPEISPIEFVEAHGGKKHRYVSACRTINNDTVAFYARLHDNPDAKRKFINEIKFLKKIKGSKLPIKAIIPPIYQSGIERDYEWFVRAYPPYPPLGYSRQLNQKVSAKLFPVLAERVLEISRIPVKKLGLKIRQFNFKNYLIAPQCQGLAKEGLISRDLANKISHLISRASSLLSQENHYPNHGDLNLGNILVENDKIWLIDWELFHYNNFAYDIGYLWAHLWQAPRTFRQGLLTSFIKKLTGKQLKKFKILLPVVAAYLSIGGIAFRNTRNEKLLILEKRRRFYVKLLKNCTGRFTDLIKT